MNLSQYFYKFFNSSQSSGVLLMVAVVLALLIANSSFGAYFTDILNYEIGIESLSLKYSISSWINDALMTIFFLLVGLEIKREVIEGELSDIKNASLPIVAAIGGMLIPALIYFIMNYNTPQQTGWAIPMATDIAFSLAIISMLGKRVPSSIKIFLTALAIVDDLGAIIVIAIFYTEHLHWFYLALAGAVLLLLIILNKLKVTKIIFYIIPGIFLWYFMHHSGIHATIAGVLLAFCIPTNESTTEISALEKLEEQLHFPVNYLIMPIFAFANTNIILKSGMLDNLFSGLGLGIILGLVFGKVLGINLFSWIAIKSGMSELPFKSTWKQMIGAGFLAGIGFTMSIFIVLLSFKNNINLQEESKFAILLASLISGIIGFLLLKFTYKSLRKS